MDDEAIEKHRDWASPWWFYPAFMFLWLDHYVFQWQGVGYIGNEFGLIIGGVCIMMFLDWLKIRKRI